VSNVKKKKVKKKTEKPTIENPKDLAGRIGIPVSNVRYLIKSGKLEHVYTSPGKRNPKIPAGAWERYLQEHAVR